MTDHTPIRPLTDRQLEIAECIGDGLTYEEIGAQLGISVHTVHHHVKMIVLLLPTMRHVSARRRIRFFIRATRARQPA